MNIELKPRKFIAIGLAIAILVVGYFYMKKTAPKRAYKAEIRQLRMISEHQGLEIEVVNQRATLEAMNKAAKAGTPTFNLAPPEPEAKREDPNQ